MEIALVLSIFCFVLVSLHLLHRKTVKNNQPPGPEGFPIIGNLHQFESANRHVYLSKLSRKHGPVMQLKLGYRTILAISSAEAAKEALKTNDLVFSGRPTLAGQKKLSYNGRDLGLSSFNEYNKEMRKIFAVHLFSHTRVQSFRPIRENEIFLAIEEISKLSSHSQVINLSSMMLNVTSNIICTVAFGKRFDKRTQQRKRFDAMLDEGQAMLAGFFLGDYIPWLSWIDKITGMKNRLEKCFSEFDSFYQELIDEHLDPNRQETMKEDIIDILIGLKEQQLPDFDLTWDHIKALLTDIFIAGADPAASAIVWAMTALMKKPFIMKRGQMEIREVVGRKDKVDEVDLQKLIYLKAIVKEALRLYPPAPLLGPRETTKNCIIEGYDIKAKTIAFVNEWAIARDPKCWENPEEFNPERFMSSNVDIKIEDFNMIPFGAGRRICPGKTMAIATVELALANLLYKYDWEIPLGMKIEDIDTDASPGLTMHKKNALCLVAKKRL